jgi:hypothetical protein
VSETIIFRVAGRAAGAFLKHAYQWLTLLWRHKTSTEITTFPDGNSVSPLVTYVGSAHVALVTTIRGRHL